MDVQYQSWGDHLTKFDAALAGGTAPDVIELGNTETTRYMASRLLRGPDDSDKELPELQDVAEGAQGLVYLQRAPLLRAVLRGRTRRHLPEDQYKAAVKSTPKSLAEFQARARS